MTFSHVVFITIGWVVLLAPMTCTSFVVRPEPVPLINTELSMKRTVTERFSFSKRSNNSENMEFTTDDNDDEEALYHRRIVHFELDSEKTQEKNNQMATRKYKNKATSNRKRKFELNHQTLHP
mmetsp:Transcript_14213/g.30872  ORF Transcript_14213/g.30872 Transcript_14213/m.30872 type:complete len:123 (+) Transcript_14213:174-542(+)|eukprot:CAMPEP_0172310522 /NCGR_PEP_ID=MMETSP1058-20130122/11534_1 /TAXON_ID=83371 /ORGANISM="Detonula confervacea, Strain CCMP 353" /LENGTH=122 /DNA_ID=CAMNT_0013023341 /DNA_START=174 /DNA_END=542 /DNA_ORIENTATION=-